MLLAVLMMGLTVLAVSAQGTEPAAPANPAAPSAPTAATVGVAHFAPFATEAISTSVSVQVNGSNVITDFVFAERVEGLSLPAGTYTISIVPTGVITPALESSATVAEGDDVTLAAIGGANGWPLELFPLVNDRTPFTATGKIRIGHLAPFAATLDGTRVDICTDAGAVFGGLANIPYKAVTDYIALPGGIYDLNIALAGTSCATVALDLPPFQLRPGQVAEVLAIGLPAVPGVPLQVSQSGLGARVSVAHLAPFANTPAGTSVSVVLSNTTILTNFVYSTLTPYLDIALGSYPVEIIPTGASSPAITGTAVITGFLDFTLAAVGNGTLQPLELVRFEDDNDTAPAAGSSRLQLTHAAPFASDASSAAVASTAVDLCISGTTTPVISNLVYLDRVTTELPQGLYSLFAAAGGSNCATRLFNVPPVASRAGEIGSAYAIGDVVNAAPTVIGSASLAPNVQLLPSVFKPLSNIVDTARGAGSFTTLLAALEAAGLSDTLRGPGPFTVFAPTDAAFAKLPQATLDALLADPKGQLTQILLYHVVPGRVLSSSLSNGQAATTVQGGSVTFTVNSGGVKVNSANVVTPDVQASNGVIHVIDEVLLPPSN
jgi:uncharacterized surface protein with fasciclin (FAS1) repeats